MGEGQNAPWSENKRTTDEEKSKRAEEKQRRATRSSAPDRTGLGQAKGETRTKEQETTAQAQFVWVGCNLGPAGWVLKTAPGPATVVVFAE